MSKKISLKGGNKILKIPPAISVLEPAHVSRYLIMARLIKQIIGTNNSAKILDVGGKKGLLREFGIKSTIIDMEASNEVDFIQGDALKMPFDDNSFDVVVSCDVLEHIPEKDRERFVAEMLRVSKGFAVIGAPFDLPGVSNSEKEANKFYKEIANKEHRWLIEHIENGLPDKKKIEAFLKKQKFHYQFFRHLSLEVWDMTTRIHFLHAAFGDSTDIGELALGIYKKYYDNLCEFDFSDNAYRTFCVINKDENFTVELPAKEKQQEARASYVAFLNEEFLKALSGLGLERRNHHQRKTAKQAEKIAQLDAELMAVRKELLELKESKSYKLAERIRKTKNFYK